MQQKMATQGRLPHNFELLLAQLASEQREQSQLKRMKLSTLNFFRLFQITGYFTVRNAQQIIHFGSPKPRQPLAKKRAEVTLKALKNCCEKRPEKIANKEGHKEEHKEGTPP